MSTMGMHARWHNRLRITLGALSVLFGACTHHPAPEGHARTISASTAPPPATGQATFACEAETLPPLGFQTLDDQIIYLVLLDRFHDGDGADFEGRDPENPLAFFGGDLDGLTQKLPYLADLGVTTLWLTPIAPQVEAPVGDGNQAHWPLHGYWPKRLTGIDARFGDPAAFCRLLNQAHGAEMRVVLDVVVNHLGYGAEAAVDSTWIRSPRDHTCPQTQDARTQCLFGLPDLRTEDTAVREYIVAETLSWVDDYPIDGFRLDAAKHVDRPLLTQIYTGIQQRFGTRHRGRALVVAEHWGAARGDGIARSYRDDHAADVLFDFSFAENTEDFLAGRMRAKTYGHHLRRAHEAGDPPDLLYLSTHDTSPLSHRLAAHPQRYAIAPFLLMTQFGIPLVRYGEELGLPGTNWPDNRRPMPWSSLHAPEGQRFHRLWRGLIQLRRRSAELRGRDLTVLVEDSDGERATLVYRKGERFWVAVHLGPATRVQIPSMPANQPVWPCLATPQASSSSPLTVSSAGVLRWHAEEDSAVIWARDEDACASIATTRE